MRRTTKPMENASEILSLCDEQGREGSRRRAATAGKAEQSPGMASESLRVGNQENERAGWCVKRTVVLLR